VSSIITAGSTLPTSHEELVHINEKIFVAVNDKSTRNNIPSMAPFSKLLGA
jgi:hypothetical protein